MLKSTVNAAVQIIRNGGVVAFPTETYYGLAVDPANESALRDLYRLKQRESEKPVLVLIDNSNSLGSVVSDVPDVYRPLMAKYWPGPLTLIFPAKKTLPSLLTGHTDTVGVRVSPHPVAAALVQTMGKAITATSANLSGNNPARSAGEVKSIFGNRIDYILDGGETAGGRCSTLVGLKDGKLTVFREGQIDLTTEMTGQFPFV